MKLSTRTLVGENYSWNSLENNWDKKSKSLIEFKDISEKVKSLIMCPCPILIDNSPGVEDPDRLLESRKDREGWRKGIRATEGLLNFIGTIAGAVP
jgi:hypothetical protein